MKRRKKLEAKLSLSRETLRELELASLEGAIAAGVGKAISPVCMTDGKIC